MLRATTAVLWIDEVSHFERFGVAIGIADGDGDGDGDGFAQTTRAAALMRCSGSPHGRRSAAEFRKRATTSTITTPRLRGMRARLCGRTRNCAR